MPRIGRRVCRGILLVCSLLTPLPGLSLGWAGSGAPGGTGSEVGAIRALVVEPRSNALLAGTSKGLFRSEDEGKSWRLVAARGPVEGKAVLALALDPTEPRTVYAAGRGFGVAKSRDGGQSWERTNQDLGGTEVIAFALDVSRLPTRLSSSKRLYAWVEGKGLYRATAERERWELMDEWAGNPGVKSLASVNIPSGMGGILVYAGTAKGLFWSADCF